MEHIGFDDNKQKKLIDNIEIKRVVSSIFEKISRQKKYKSDSINILNEVLAMLNGINKKDTNDER